MELKKKEIFISELPPISLYVHFPWCIKKCPYCDFNSHQVSQENFPHREYAEALVTDLNDSIPLIQDRKIQNIFLGGGTPSLLPVKTIGTFLKEVYLRTNVSNDCEITLEVNPGSTEIAKFEGFRSAGVKRLSIGVQSFNDVQLGTLGRVHSSTDALTAIEQAAKFFDYTNVDIMYALPNQTLLELKEDIATLISTAVNHVSLYQLTIEPKTLFFRYPPKLPSDDLSWEMEQLIKKMILEAGYNQYEISAYAKTGYESRHNTNYWKFGDYVGIGAGAHGKISFLNKVIRIEKIKSPMAYIKGSNNDNIISQNFSIPVEDLPGEFMMNTLRLRNGFDLKLFPERTGLALENIIDLVDKLRQKGLVEINNNQLKPTATGFRFVNDLIQDFM